jgi:hypothetical protein
MLRVLTAADTLKRSPRLPGAEGRTRHSARRRCRALAATKAWSCRRRMPARHRKDGRRSWRVEGVVADPGHACVPSTRARQGWPGWACSKAEANHAPAGRSRWGRTRSKSR